MVGGADNTLLARVASGDRGAVRDCIERFGPTIRGMARRMLGSGPDADDAVQEAFISVWRAAGKFDPDVASESTYILTIARRRLIDSIRARRRSPRLEAYEEGSTMAPEVRENVDDDAAKARIALAQLREDERRVIELTILSGLSQTEVAQSTGMPLGTVKTHARRGLIHLRALLNKAMAKPGLRLASGAGLEGVGGLEGVKP